MLKHLGEVLKFYLYTIYTFINIDKVKELVCCGYMSTNLFDTPKIKLFVFVL